MPADRCERPPRTTRFFAKKVQNPHNPAEITRNCGGMRPKSQKLAISRAPSFARQKKSWVCSIICQHSVPCPPTTPCASPRPDNFSAFSAEKRAKSVQSRGKCAKSRRNASKIAEISHFPRVIIRAPNEVSGGSHHLLVSRAMPANHTRCCPAAGQFSAFSAKKCGKSALSRGNRAKSRRNTPKIAKTGWFSAPLSASSPCMALWL